MFSPSPMSPRFRLSWVMLVLLLVATTSAGSGKKLSDSHGSKTVNEMFLNPGANESLTPGPNTGKPPCSSPPGEAMLTSLDRNVGPPRERSQVGQPEAVR